MNINLQIDRLVLDGVDLPHGQRGELQSAVETELSRLFAEGGVSPNIATDGAVPQVTVKDIQLSGGNDPVTLGRQIASSVYGGIGK